MGRTLPKFDLEVVDHPVHSAQFSALATNRTEWWQGPRQSVLSVIEDGKTYLMSGWVRLVDAPGDDIGITVRETDSASAKYRFIYWTTGHNGRWVYLSGFFTLQVHGTLWALDFYFEGPQAGVSFFLDDVSVEEVVEDRHDIVRERTEQYRKRDARITVLSPLGQPVRDVEVQVNRIKRHFAFGCAIGPDAHESSLYGNFFRDHFEWVVMGYWSQWAANERRQGSITYEHADRICGFCSRNGITMPGHCLFWASEESLPDWSLNQAGRRYEALMDEWTTRYDGVTDANGHVAFRGFHSTYEIAMTSPGTEATVRTIELEPASGTAHFTLRLD